MKMALLGLAMYALPAALIYNATKSWQLALAASLYALLMLAAIKGAHSKSCEEFRDGINALCRFIWRNNDVNLDLIKEENAK